MKTLFVCMAVLCSITCSADHESLVSANFAYRCRNGRDIVDFVYFDNQGDRLHEKAREITSHSSRCLKVTEEVPAEAFDPSCAKNSLKVISKIALFAKEKEFF